MFRKSILVALVVGLVLTGGPLLFSGEKSDKTDCFVIELSKIKDPELRARFAAYYEAVAADATAKIKPYELPLDLTKVANWADVSRKLGLKKGQEILVKNGFVVIPYGRCEKITAPYERLKMQEVPIFVTSDTLLHLYHIQFDETLKDIEIREFYPDLVKLSRAMYETSIERYRAFGVSSKAGANYVTEAWGRNAIFFATALTLLDEPMDTSAKGLKEMPAADLKDFLQGIKNISKEKEFRHAWQSLFYGGNRDAGAIKTILKYYKAPKHKPLEMPKWVKTVVDEEIAFMNKHAGFETSPLFCYKEDYSQYVPRGHYTRRFILKKYFKAMMWYGRLTFIIKPKIIKKDTQEKKEREAKIQTLQAALIAATADKIKVGERSVTAIWDRLYAVTAFYVGLADDLTLYEYRDVMLEVFGAKFKTASMLDEKKWFAFRKELALLRKPQIYGGTGDIVGPPAGIATEKDLQEALADTQGLRFMGQRFIPDSYMMGKLVYPTVGPYRGSKPAFTTIRTDGGIIRGFPRGLDVMALLGSDRARHHLERLGDTNYENYDEAYNDLAEEFAKFDEKDWNRNLYWSWLYSLKALLEPADKGTQSFMQTEAWADKQLNASLASWAELRHDTILYAKQSYTMRPTGMPMQPKPVVGYVEPVPEFYGRLLALTQMTRKGLASMNVLDQKATARIESLEKILRRLLDISIAELENKELKEEDYQFIRNFAQNLEAVVAGVDTEGDKTTMIADVHTDCNSRQCLEEGVGYVKLIVVAYRLPDGRILVGAGPVMTHYEFKHPMSDRLTDEKWREMLKDDKAPELPEWSRNYSAK